MATYVPNAMDPSQPTGDKKVSSAAPEFRAIKVLLDSVAAAQTAFQAELDALQSAIGAGTNSVALAATLTNNIDALKGAGFIPFNSTLNYVVHSIGKEIIDSVPCLSSLPTVKMNDSTAGQRTINRSALIVAWTICKSWRVPQDATFWMDPDVEVPAHARLLGGGEARSFIKGDGDLFKWTQGVIGSPLFADLNISNDVTRGKLFLTNAGVDLPPVKFHRVQFGKSNYHIYSGDLLVQWQTVGCTFTDAAIASRRFRGAWVYIDRDSYTWFNAKGLVIEIQSSSTCSIVNCVYEYNTSYGVHLIANGADILGFNVTECHFEGNGSVGGLAEVHLETVTANRVVSVNFSGTNIFPGPGAAGPRVLLTTGGGGAFGTVSFYSGYVGGTQALVTSNAAVYIDDTVSFQVNTIPAISRRSQKVNYENSLAYLGQRRVLGTFAGNGAVQAAVTAPAGTKLVRVTVDGNNYNGVANSNTAQLIGTYSNINGNVRVTTDVNHSAGANQGFVLTAPAGVVTVANKVAMGFSQSGDTLYEFFG